MACSMAQLEEKLVVVLYITLQHCIFQYSWAILGEAEGRKKKLGRFKGSVTVLY